METKRTIFVLTAVAIFLPDFIKCDCKINSGFYNFVGAFQKIDGKFYKIPDSNDLRLSTNAVLYLICPGGFNLKENNDKFIKVKCMEDSSTKYAKVGTSTWISNEEEKAFYEHGHTAHRNVKSNIYKCEKKTFNIYNGVKDGQYCNQASYAVGYELGNTIITVVDFCFNALYKRLEYTHFVQNHRSHFISEYYNAVNVSSNEAASLPAAEFFEPLPSLDSNDIYNHMFFKENIFGYSFPFSIDTFPLMSEMPYIIWLKSLLNGQSLKTFKDILEKRKETVQYEVFIGSSGKIKIPNKNYKNATSEEVNIPIYVWHYLKSKDSPVEENFVAIFINSPFINYKKLNETVFCEDICDSIDWLNPMENIRHMPHMGYMFCCNTTEDVTSFLDGFPRSIN